jgi:uncharacterized protein YqfA (UPF0365 family)
MSKLSVITIASSASVILLTLLITAAPLVWIGAIAAGLFLGTYPVFRAARLAPVEARHHD